MDEQNNSTNTNNNTNTNTNTNNATQGAAYDVGVGSPDTSTSKQGGGDAAANAPPGAPPIVELIENLVSQIQENDERLRELNSERYTIHRSLRECRQQLDNIMEQYRLEVIVKNGKEYRPKQK